MSNKSSNGSAAPGVEVPTISEADALRMINRDLPMAIACLNAIHSDPDMKKLMAKFMIGRVENYNEKARIAKVESLNQE